MWHFLSELTVRRLRRQLSSGRGLVGEYPYRSGDSLRVSFLPAQPAKLELLIPVEFYRMSCKKKGTSSVKQLGGLELNGLLRSGLFR